MDTLEVARQTAGAIGSIGGRFMLDGATYVRGAELGFAGLDFYAGGRGGVLGEVDAGVVTAAFAFFEPEYVRTQWELSGKVLPRLDAAREFAACGAAWGEAHVPDDFDAERLAALAAQVTAAARLACAPVFAAWLALDEPSAPKALVVHRINGLRELRNGLHAAAVVASGLSPHQAVSLRSPGMATLFGWPDVADTDGLDPIWEGAEAATDGAMAHAFEGLDDAERAEFTTLANELNASAT
jgi:hypothetical protein